MYIGSTSGTSATDRPFEISHEFHTQKIFPFFANHLFVFGTVSKKAESLSSVE
jgi:hypothetical protein